MQEAVCGDDANDRTDNHHRSHRPAKEPDSVPFQNLQNKFRIDWEGDECSSEKRQSNKPELKKTLYPIWWINIRFDNEIDNANPGQKIHHAVGSRGRMTCRVERRSQKCAK